MLAHFSLSDLFIQVSEEGTGPPPTDEMSIRKESTWIYDQLAAGILPSRTTEEGRELSINKDDIMRYLDFMHVQKLDVSIGCSIDLHFSC